MDEMDLIDQKQQREIDDMREVNKRQDRFMTHMVWAFVFYGIILVFGQFMYVSRFDETCVHPECHHHKK